MAFSLLAAGLVGLSATAAPNCPPGPIGRWVAMNPTAGPEVTPETRPIWTGSELFVFNEAGGAAFDPCANRWRRLASPARVPQEARPALLRPPLIAGTRAVFLVAGNRFEVPMVAGGVTALVYDMTADRWSAVAAQPDWLQWRRAALAVAAGKEIVIWGGVREEFPGGGGRAILLADGARLDPATGAWHRLSTEHAPSARSYPRGIWTGTRLAVWGGVGTQRNPYQCGEKGDCLPTGGGALYDPATDTWTPMSEQGAPAPRSGFALQAIGASVLVWGGYKHPDGALYDVAAGRWQPLPPPPEILAGDALDGFEVAAAGSKLTVITNRQNVAIYDPATSTWTAVREVQLPHGMPDLRTPPGSGLRLIVAHPKEGERGVGWLARVNPDAARWELAPLGEGAPSSLDTGMAGWTGTHLVLWGRRFQQVRYVPDGVKPCGPHRAGEPICDPEQGVREIRLGRGGWEGGILRPAFAPVSGR